MSQLSKRDFELFNQSKVWKSLLEILEVRKIEIQNELLEADEIPHMKVQQGRLRELNMFILYPSLLEEDEVRLDQEAKQERTEDNDEPKEKQS